jgi:LEA14-like dessication related protein
VVKAPDISFGEVRRGKRDILSQRTRIEVDLGIKAADQGSTVNLSGFDYGIRMGSAKVASGMVDQLAELTPGSQQTITLPLDLDLKKLAGSLVSAITGKGQVDLGLNATVKVGTPFGVIPLSIDETGKVNIN